MTISTTDILADFEQLTAPAQPQISLADFRRWLKSQHLSPASISNYLSDANQFIAFAGTQSIDSSHFVDYLNHLNSLNTPRSTVNRKLASLRQLAKFLQLDVHFDKVPQPLIDNLLKNFHYYLRTKRHSSKTITNYLSDLRHYLNWAYESK